MMPLIRRGEPADLGEVAAIQEASPEAAQWPASDYFAYEFRVAVEYGRVVGFIVWRSVAADECELLNLAVGPEWRRNGIAKELLAALFASCRHTIFLEVRESKDRKR